jgi:hypothetical protein
MHWGFMLGGLGGFLHLNALVLQSAILLITALGTQLPLGVSLWVQGLVLACYLSTNRERCVFECAASHAQEFYEGLACTGSVIAAKVMPIGVASRRDNLFLGVTACMLLQVWVQVVVWYVLPVLVIDCLEVRSQARLQRHPWARSPGAQLVLGHVGLLVLASVVGWRGLELALSMWPRLHPGGAHLLA